MSEKPPLGVMPEKLWRELRALELAETIVEAVAFDASRKALSVWSEELHRHLCWLSDHPQGGGR